MFIILSQNQEFSEGKCSSVDLFVSSKTEAELQFRILKLLVEHLVSHGGGLMRLIEFLSNPKFVRKKIKSKKSRVLKILYS